jgi:hypothetical protein
MRDFRNVTMRSKIMSDYGTAISITKKDNTEFDSSEKDAIKTVVTSLRNLKKYKGLAGDFIFDLGGDDNTLDLMLLAYWHPDVGEKEATRIFEKAKAHDLPITEEVVKKLKDELGDRYVFDPYFSAW